MEQAATPGGLGLPCSPQQALVLYQHLFRCPADLGQLQVALQQVQEGQACRSGLELPTALLQMERRRRAQEQLLWDLELLTGAGLGLFWPPWAQFCGLRGQAQGAGSQCSKLRRRMESAERLMRENSRQCPSSQAEDSLSQSHQLLGGGKVVAPSSAPDLGEARSDTDARPESPSMPAEEPTPGCLQELNPTTSSCFGEPGNAEFKDLAQREERGQAEPMPQRPHPPSPRSPQEEQLAQGAPGPSALPSQGLLEPQDSPEAQGWSLSPERAELQKVLRTEIPQGQRGEALQGEDEEVPQRKREKTHQDQSREAIPAPREEVPEGPRTEAPQGQSGSRAKCRRKDALQEAQEDSPKGLPSFEGRGRVPQAWEVAGGEGEEGGSLRIGGHFCRSLGEQMPRPGGKTAQLMPVKTDDQKAETTPAAGEQGPAGEGARARLPSATRSPLAGAGAGMLAALRTRGSGQSERLEALPGHLALVRDPHALQGPGRSPSPAKQEVGGSTGLPGALGERRGGSEAPKASKAAWPEAPGRHRASAGVSAAQQETALQQLLELHREARRRRQQDREQQRLRVRGGAGRACERAGHGAAAGWPLTEASFRSWNASASPGTATAGCTPWDPHRVHPSSRHRQEAQEKAVGGGAGRNPGAYEVRAPRAWDDTCGEREAALPGAAPCWPQRARGLGGGGLSAWRPPPPPGGRGGAAAGPAGAAGANAPGENRAAASPRSQEHPELPAVTVAPWR